VSAWEIAIKQSLGKLDLPRPAEQWLPEVLRRSGFEVAEVGVAAAVRVRSLPWHHRDPVDRLLVFQAWEDGFTLVTCDGVRSRGLSDAARAWACWRKLAPEGWR